MIVEFPGNLHQYIRMYAYSKKKLSVISDIIFCFPPFLKDDNR